MTSALESASTILRAHYDLMSDVRALQRENRRLLSGSSSHPESFLSMPLLSISTPSPPAETSDIWADNPSGPKSQKGAPGISRPDLPPSKLAKLARYPNFVPEEETIRNDYAQRYVDNGDWPQNWVLGAEPEKRFEEYPKQQRLLNLKQKAVEEYSILPFHCHQSELMGLSPAKFDVILIDPPFSSSFTWDNLEAMSIPSLAADPSFVFLWVGSGAGEGLERGRAILGKWGYRRCEDVVWIKTNKTSNHGPGNDPPTTSLLTRTKQHCLMGIRGTVRRSTDSWFVHCNIDTDVIIWEGDTDPTKKPPEMYSLIENFCLGLRRLEIFGRPHSLRPGWVTAGDFELSEDLARESRARQWDFNLWDSELRKDHLGRAVVLMTQEIDNIRPKSPNRQNGNFPNFHHSGQAQFGHSGTNTLPRRPMGNMMPHNMGTPFSGGVGLGIVQPQMMGFNQPTVMGNNPMNAHFGMLPPSQGFMGDPSMIRMQMPPGMLGMQMPLGQHMSMSNFTPAEMYDMQGMGLGGSQMSQMGMVYPEMMGDAMNMNMMGDQSQNTNMGGYHWNGTQ